VPELPEVETVARGLRERLIGRAIAGAWLSGKPLRMLVPIDRAALVRAVRNARVTAVRRRGKYLLMDLSTEATLLWHLGMSGQLALAAAATPRPAHTHVALALDRAEELRFRDPRRFGWLAIYPQAEVAGSAELRALGPDPLDGSFTREVLAAALRATRGANIKAFLLDQRRIAGVGNIYASEALFVAGIHPRRKAASLTVARAARLHDAIVEVLETAVKNRGTSFRDYVDAEGWLGENQNHLRVFMRAGQPCPRCGARLRRLTQQARSTFYCPQCQR
jgi:formamidopyrimidine-DNA glycosylase